MEIFLPYIGGIIFLYYLLKLLNRDDDSEAEVDETDQQCNEAVQPPFDTHGLMIKALSDLGCQPTADKEGVISVAYQGEKFKIICNGVCIRVCHAYWAAVNIYDPDLPKVRQAVNAANVCFGPTITIQFSLLDDKGNLYLSSIWDIVLHPALPNIEGYAKTVLDALFELKQHMLSTIWHQAGGLHEKSSPGER